MAETPEEVAKALLEEITDCENGATEHWNCIPPVLPHLASALRAQYVAGLEKAAEHLEGPLLAARYFDANRLEHEADLRRYAARIRELAEQAKREG